jgi:hypothetical protein
MRSLVLLFASLLASVSVAAAAPAHGHAEAKPAAKPTQAAAGATNAPRSMGKFDDWQAATHSEAGQPVCYAFTRAQRSEPALPGRGDVVLTVTERATGRDAVAISAGFAYASGAEVQVQVDQTTLPFYTAARSAFARDGKAVVTAFERGSKAMAKSPAPKNATVNDTFSLRGFAAAYQAISKACPPK